MRLTVLVENEARAGLVAEHGLALWIEADGLRVLFDTGQGPALAENAHRLGVPLEAVDHLVLSHGHYDHTGGVAEVLRRAPGARVWSHPGALAEHWSCPLGQPARSIGLPASAHAALSAAQVDWLDGPRQLGPGLEKLS